MNISNYVQTPHIRYISTKNNFDGPNQLGNSKIYFMIRYNFDIIGLRLDLDH